MVMGVTASSGPHHSPHDDVYGGGGGKPSVAPYGAGFSAWQYYRRIKTDTNMWGNFYFAAAFQLFLAIGQPTGGYNRFRKQFPLRADTGCLSARIRNHSRLYLGKSYIHVFQEQRSPLLIHNRDVSYYELREIYTCGLRIVSPAFEDPAWNLQ